MTRTEETAHLEDNIDLLNLIRKVLSQSRYVLKIIGVSLFIGVLIAFSTPNEYKASCMLIVEMSNVDGKLNGSLGGLASLAGIDIGGMSSGSSTINPSLYKSISESTPFLLQLMQEQFYFAELNKQMSLFVYFNEYNKSNLLGRVISWPGQILNQLREREAAEDIKPGSANDGLLSLSKSGSAVARALRERVVVEMDWDLNVITVDVKMQDPVVAAKVAQFTQKYITDYVKSYSVAKSTSQLQFVEKQYEERKLEFERVQRNLARFQDSNKYINSAEAQSEERMLRSEYDLAFDIYNELARQKEQISLQVNSNTPVFTVLEPVFVPNTNSNPSKLLQLFVSIVIGTFTGVFIVVLKLVKNLL